MYKNEIFKPHSLTDKISLGKLPENTQILEKSPSSTRGKKEIEEWLKEWKKKSEWGGRSTLSPFERLAIFLLELGKTENITERSRIKVKFSD